MVVLLAVVVIGGLVWLARLSRGRTRTDRARTDGAGPGLPDRPLGGKRVADALMSQGRIDVRGLTKEYRGLGQLLMQHLLAGMGGPQFGHEGPKSS